MSMVGFGKIAKIVRNSSDSKIEWNQMKIGEACYEAGMVEILREIALKSFGQAQIPNSVETQEALDSTEDLYKEIDSHVVDPNLHELVKQLHKKHGEAQCCSGEDHFVEGFIAGYRFLKSQAY